MSINNRSMVRTVLATFQATGTKPPKAIAQAQADAEKITATAGTLHVDDMDLTRAVAEALLDDRDPFTDDRVAAATIAARLRESNVINSLEDYSSQRIADAFTEAADDIVEIWRKPFDQAAARLTEAAKRIGDTPLDDGNSILALGGDIAEIWAGARADDAMIQKITFGWAVLGDLTRRANLSSQYRVLRIADVPPRRARLELRNVKLTPWEVVTKGLTLSMPTFTQAIEREAAVLADVNVAQLEDTKAMADTYKRFKGSPAA